MTGMRERTERDGITAEAVSSSARPSWDEGRWSGFAYTVTLHMDERILVTPFFMGEALTDEPDAAEVLQSLVSDAASIENAQGFEDWAADLGFDADSRKAEASYRQCAEQTDRLRVFLGDAYDAYLWDTEGL